MTWSKNGDLALAAAEDVQNFGAIIAASDTLQIPSINGIVSGQAAQSYGGSKAGTQHLDYFNAWNKAFAAGPNYKARTAELKKSYWADELKKPEMATVNTIIGRINWSLRPDIAVAATEDTKQFLVLQDEFKASITNNVFNAVLDSGADSFNAYTNDINYATYAAAWRAAGGFGPQIKTRSVFINAKDPELADDSKADINTAQNLAKQIKWSLNPNPIEQATEDAQQFLKLAYAAKTFPNFNVATIISFFADRTANGLPGLAEYGQTWSKLVGGNETDYWTRVLGEKPTKTWFDGGIKAIGDIVIAGMHDPKSYQFNRFTVSVRQSKGTPAWKVDYYFRGKNAFGGLVLGHVYAYMLHGEVIGIEQPND